MKKFLVVLLSLVVCLSVFGGGGGQQSRQGGTGKAGTLADGNVTFTMFYFGGINPNTTSMAYEDNAFTKRIVDETGIKLDISSMSSADSPQRLNVMLNSGDYPDIIFGRNFTIAELDYYGTQQNIFVPLDQYNIRQYSGVSQIMTKYPTLDLVIRGSDGKIYGMPAVNGCDFCIYRSGKVGYYMPFIRDNNLKVPDTYDEFADYLRWVRDNDVNKNGNRNDEIPMMWRNTDTRNAIAFFAKGFMPFVMYNEYYGLALYDKKVTEQYRLPEFRDTLRFMAQLYRENLIAPDSFTMTNDEARALAYSDPPIVAVTGLAQLNQLMTTNSPRWLETFILPVMKARDGNRYAPNYAPWQNQRNFMSITDKCKDPALAVRFYDYLLSFEMQLLSNQGEKGVIWDYADPGALSISGGPARWKSLSISSTGSSIINVQWMNGNWSGWLDEWRESVQAFDIGNITRWLDTGDPSLLQGLTTNMSYNEAHNYIETRKMMPYAIPVNYYIPPIGMNEADSIRITDIMVNFNTYLDTAMVEFITGVRNINNDTDWNTFNNDLVRLGSADRASIIQKYIK